MILAYVLLGLATFVLLWVCIWWASRGPDDIFRLKR